jgi:hypothetical protein
MTRKHAGTMAGAVLLVLLFVTWAWAADRIIVLGQDPSRGGLLGIRAVFWFHVPTVADRLPCPGCGSAYPEASSAEMAMIQSGELIEESGVYDVADGKTGPQIQTDLQAFWTSRKAYLDSKPPRGAYYGRTMNDAGAWRQLHCPGGVGCP